MSLDINWKRVVEEVLQVDSFGTLLTGIINTLPIGSPIGNFKLLQFELPIEPSPVVEIIDVGEVRDEFLTACGLMRSITSPPPTTTTTNNEALCFIDSTTLLFDRKANASMVEAALGDGLQVTISLQYEAGVKASFEADALLNMPAPAFLALPFKIGLSHVHIDCQLSIVILPSGQLLLSLPKIPTHFHLQLAVDVGDPEKHVLRNVAKIERFLTEQLKSQLQAQLLFPNFRELSQ